MRTIAFLLTGLLGAGALMAQEPTAADSTGLPGDDFSLQGALELFKNAKDLESFEKAINDPEKKVNNLDLNGDDQVDYVRVTDVAKCDVHAVVLRVPVNGKESQDVAVIELEKNGDKSVRALIRGDAVLYGDSVLLEPVSEMMKQEKSTGGPAMGEVYPVYVWVNVWGWPCVNWMYGPSYVLWDSPWYWGYYPGWYRPWRPWGWHAWYGYSYHHHGWCQPVYYNEPTQASVIYAPRRSMSARVVEHTRPVRESRAAQGARSPYLRDTRRGTFSTSKEAGGSGREAQRPVTRPDTQRPPTGKGTQEGRQARPSDQQRPTARPEQGDVKPGTRPDRERPNTKPARQPRERTREARPAQPSRQQPRSPSAPRTPRRSR
jgi:hypothetical protein